MPDVGWIALLGHARRRSALWALTLVLAANGCSYQTVLLRSSPNAKSIATTPQGAPIPVQIESVSATLNGADQNPSTEFMFRFESKLDRTNLFSSIRLGGGGPPHSTRLVLKVAERLDVPNARAELSLDVVRPNGQKRHYSSFAEAMATWGVLSSVADIGEAVRAAQQMAMEAALIALMNQLIADAEFVSP